jgi:hypothetical protein
VACFWKIHFLLITCPSSKTLHPYLCTLIHLLTGLKFDPSSLTFIRYKYKCRSWSASYILHSSRPSYLQ